MQSCRGSVRIARNKQLYCTHIVTPLDLLGVGPGVDGALEVDVVVLLQVRRVQRPTETQLQSRGV